VALRYCGAPGAFFLLPATITHIITLKLCLDDCCQNSAVYPELESDAPWSFFRPGANKPLNKLLTDSAATARGKRMSMCSQSAAYDPEELSLLGDVLDRAVEALPPGMRTTSNRRAIARNILELAATGVRDRLALEQAATTDLKIVAVTAVNTRRPPCHMRQSHNRPTAAQRLPSFRQTRMASSVNE
jgi:hypothetical protein